MAYALADRVREVTSTTGTADIALGGASGDYQAFGNFLANGDTTHYCVFSGTQWEVGLGTYVSGTDTLQRTTVLDGSDGPATKITLAAGSKTVFCTSPAASLELLPILAGIEPGADVTDKENVAAAIAAGGGKTTLVGADRLPTLDSEDSYKLKYNTLTNFLSMLGSTFYTKTEVDAALAAALTSARKRGTVRAATITNITISTALNNGDTLDGVTLATGDWVLVKDQSTGSQNGIYVVGGAPARAVEFDTWDEHVGSVISVQEGTVNGDKVFMCTSNVGGTLNTTAITFAPVTINGELLSANNLSDLANAGTALTNLGLSANGKALVATNYAGMLTLLGIEANADVTDEANVRAALAALTTSVIINKQAIFRVGTINTQTVMETYGWTIQQRMAWVLESTAGLGLYSYSADGMTVKRPFYCDADGNVAIDGALSTDYLSLLDNTAAGSFRGSFFIGSTLTANRSYLFNMPDSVQTYTFPAQNGTVMITGEQSIPIAAAGCISPASAGAADDTLTLTNQTFQTKAFDASTAESIFFDIRMPRQWDESTIKFDYGWLHRATTTNFGVAFGLSAVAISNDDTGDPSFGTEVIVSDTGGTTSDWYQSAKSAAVTVGGTPQAGDLVRFKLRRIPTDGADTMAIDALLNDINIYFTNDSGNDA